MSIAIDYAARLGLTFAPSAYQAAIFDWITTGVALVNGREVEPWSVVVDAVAGAGKTTTSVNAIRLACETEPGISVLAVSFNREIAEVLGERLQGTGAKSSTAHAHGLSVVSWYCYARIGLNGAVEVDVDKSERKYADMLAAAAHAIADRLASGHAPTLCGVSLTDAQALALLHDDEDEHPVTISDACSLGHAAVRSRVAANLPVSECAELCNLARLFVLDFDSDDFARSLDVLARRYDVEVDALLWPLVVTAVRNALRRGCTPPRAGKWLIDFTDMIWLPVVLGLRPGPRSMYDLICVDECQDISTAARRLLIGALKRGGRMMWVGDPNQAINGFAGADSDSFEAIIRETNAAVLPLSVCYRCPTLHLAVARQWRPDIEARTGAPAGVIRRVERADYAEIAERGDLVICRRTAPLVSLCFELIAAGVSATVRGRADMSKGLVLLAKRASKGLRGDAWAAEFGDRLTARAKIEAEKIVKRSRDEAAAGPALDALADRVECVRVIVRSSGARSLAEATAAIERIFADKSAAVVLSTVHRAKGLEADRVVILESNRLISPRATQRWQIEQEHNLCYVAYTRAKREIIEILAPKKEREA